MRPSIKKIFVDAISPNLSTAGLQALLKALQNDDYRLEQGCTTHPRMKDAMSLSPVEYCCAIGFCFWQGDGLTTVSEVEYRFAHCCYEADDFLNETAGCRHFLVWFDDTPRAEMRLELAAVVDEVLADRILELARHGGQS